MIFLYDTLVLEKKPLAFTRPVLSRMYVADVVLLYKQEEYIFLQQCGKVVENIHLRRDFLCHVGGFLYLCIQKIFYLGNGIQF